MKVNADGSRRVFIQMTPNEILTKLTGRTDERAAEAVTPFLLNWIALSGAVQNYPTRADGIVMLSPSFSYISPASGARERAFLKLALLSMRFAASQPSNPER